MSAAALDMAGTEAGPKRLADDLISMAAGGLIIVTAAFLVLPLAITVMMAFDARTYLGPLPPSELSLQWFRRFFGESYFLRGLRTSALLAACTVIASMLIGVATAFVFDRYEFAGKRALAAFFLSPLVVPPVVIGFALLLFLSTVGVFQGFVRLLTGHLIITLPFTIRATLAGLAGIDRSLTEAALSLGARERHAFWEITMPLARTGIISGGIFAFAISFDDVAVSMFLTDANTYTLPVALVSSMRAKFDLTIAAASCLLIAVTVLLILVLERFVGLNRFVGQGIYRS